MKYGTQKLMVHLPYSRELSLLLVFERNAEGTLRIHVFYNGEILVETLRYNMGRLSEARAPQTRLFSLKAMTYSTYQGVLYVCFGTKHPLYRFRIDEDALAKFNDHINKVYEGKQKEIEGREEFMEAHRDEFQAIDPDSSGNDPVFLEELPDKSVTAYEHHQHVVEKVKLENPDILKALFAFEALEWPVTSWTPAHLTELLQTDADKVNETLQRASEEEKDKDAFLLRTAVVAPFANRLWCFGSPTNAHQITASAKGDFSDFDVAYPSLVHARSPLSPIIGTFVSETFDAVLWSVPFGEELLVATTDGIYVLKEGQRDKGEFVKIHKELHLSVAPIKPVVLDKALFFVEGNRKNISCLTWSRERGGYQVHSLTAYADHLFTSSIVRLEAVRTPFNMLFVLLGDGHFNVFTHDADLKILGWTQHYLGGDARIIDMCAIPTLKDDMVFFWGVRDGIEYLEVLRTGQISTCPTLVREGTYLDCSAKLQDEAEIVIDKAVQSLIDTNEFFCERDITTDRPVWHRPVWQGYALLSKQLHHQIDRDAEQFDIKDFLIDGVPWENLASGVFVQGTMAEGRFIPDHPVEDEAVQNLLDSAPFIKGSYLDGLFVENYPLDGNYPDPQFLHGKLLGADPLKGNSRKFLKRYFKTARKAILKNVGRWGAFLEGLQELIRFPANMSVQNFNFYTVSKKIDQLRHILEEIRADTNRRAWERLAWDNLFVPGHRDFVVTHKTKPHINFHSQKEFLLLKEDAIDEFHKILSMFLRLFQPFLDNIGLRNDFETIQSFVTHINKSFLEFMAGFESQRGNLFGQISFLSDKSYHSKDFWQNAFSFDLVSRGMFATKEMIFRLKALAAQGYYKGKPFRELDTERKVLFLKSELGKLLEEKEQHIKVRPQTQFVPKNMNIALIDKTRIILDVCASLGLGTDSSNPDAPAFDFAVAADALTRTVRDGNITPTIERMRGDTRVGNARVGDGAEAAEEREGRHGSAGSFGSDGSEDSHDARARSRSGSERKSFEPEEKSFGSDADENRGYLDFNAGSDEDLNRAIEGGDPEPVWSSETNIQRDYDNLMLELYTRMNTVRNYMERHYLLLSDQGNSEQSLNLWAEKNTFRFFKYCFLDVKNMAFYHDLFKNISLDTYTDLVQADAGARTVFTVPFLKFFPADKLTLVADNGFYEQPFTIHGDQIKLTKPIKAFSMGFNYASVLKLFPLAFNEEIDAIPKRNVSLGLKVYNTKDGWVEEHQEDGSLVTHPLRASILPHNHFNYHMADSGYLVKEVAAILAPPYQSGWLDIPMKEGIKRDICVTITVNTPAPFTLLKVSAKAQLLDRYKV